MGNQACKVAKAGRVHPSVVYTMYDLLKQENPGKYLSGLNYPSEEFRSLVEHAIDTNRDNRISNYEYIRFLVILRSTNWDGWLEELFRVFDADRDERIDRAEVRRMFAAADEMRQRPYDQQRADNFFKKVDLNRDEVLSRQEFVDSAKADPSIMNDLREMRSIILNRNA